MPLICVLFDCALIYDLFISKLGSFFVICLRICKLFAEIIIFDLETVKPILM